MIIIVKDFTRIIVDYCVMPGTSLGAEMIWLYSKEVKNNVSMLVLACMSLCYSQMYVIEQKFHFGKSTTESENTR